MGATQKRCPGCGRRKIFNGDRERQVGTGRGIDAKQVKWLKVGEHWLCIYCATTKSDGYDAITKERSVLLAKFFDGGLATSEKSRLDYLECQLDAIEMARFYR